MGLHLLRLQHRLLYYNARYYDPALGTFISSDALVPDAGMVIELYCSIRGSSGFAQTTSTDFAKSLSKIRDLNRTETRVEVRPLSLFA